MSQKAIFRCDASPEIGSGHVIRCLTLADALSRSGWQCSFSCSLITLDTIPALQGKGYDLVGLDLEGQQADLLVVDHYGLDREFETVCRAWADKILVLDDLADRPHDCDILIDQTYGRNSDDYEDLVPSSCKILAGAKYALLNPRFAEMRQNALQHRLQMNGHIERILVSMGGTNVRNITGTVLAALAQWNERKFIVDVVMRAKAFAFDDVKEQVDAMKNKVGHEVNLLTDVTDMADLMAQADLAIGAGGTTSWERCCMGLPAIMIEIADNQSLIAHKLHEAGAVINLGKDNARLEDMFINALSSLTNTPDQMLQMSRKASFICDGSGARKICEEINNAG